MIAYSEMAKAIKINRINNAILLSLLIAGGIVLSLTAIEKVFLDLMLAFS
jgi:hypothetical protein